jgi:hypothetical protein
MKTKTFTILPIEEIRIVKQLFIVKESRHNDNDISIGYILYERKLTDKYKFAETPKEEQDFNYFLEYPRQDTFPNDNIDDLILQSVKNSYPKSLVKNHTIFSSLDEEKIEIFQDRPTEKSHFKITPNLSVLDLNKLVGREFEWIQKKITIYIDSSREDLKNVAFFGHYEINDKNILDQISDVKFI